MKDDVFKIKGMSPQLLVADLQRAIDFYTGKLGFEVEFVHDDFYAGIINQSYSIHLKLGNPDREKRVQKRRNEDLDLSFLVTGIEQLYEHLQSQSVEFTQPLRKMAYGQEFYIADPDGYIQAFIEQG